MVCECQIGWFTNKNVAITLIQISFVKFSYCEVIVFLLVDEVALICDNSPSCTEIVHNAEAELNKNCSNNVPNRSKNHR